jgi:hypothetical protein
VLLTILVGLPSTPWPATLSTGQPECSWSVGAGPAYDVILSSGFLAFASHCGFLQGVEDVSTGCQSVVLSHPAAGTAWPHTPHPPICLLLLPCRRGCLCQASWAPVQALSQAACMLLGTAPVRWVAVVQWPTSLNSQQLLAFRGVAAARFAALHLPSAHCSSSSLAGSTLASRPVHSPGPLMASHTGSKGDNGVTTTGRCTWSVLPDWA